MRRRDRAIRRRLRELPVPDHAPGFWAGVERGLEQADQDESLGDLSTVVPLERSNSYAGFAPWMAAVAGAAVVLAFGAITALVFRSGGGDELATSETVVVTPGVPATMAGSTTTTSVRVADVIAPSPWSDAALSRSDVPPALLLAWDEAENKEWCSALAPEALGEVAADAEVRRARFDGGWGVAWDLPDGPGQTAAGEDCPDCGRSAFGVAGTSAVQNPGTGRDQPNTIAWSDGSFAGYGADRTAAESTRRVADVVVAGQGCVYEVWSNLGDAHLVEVLQGLRLVQGMKAAPVELRRPGDAPMVDERGAPPWAGTVIDRAEVSDLVLGQWEELGVDSSLVFQDPGVELEGAELRTWDRGVAWDAAGGEGHDADNRPCADCGRGAVGLGWQPAAPEATEDGVSLPYRITWSDGSYAEYGGRLSHPALPRDRVVYVDPETGAETADALQAIVHVAGMNHDIIVWTHLGEEHLLTLIDRLRMVSSG